MNLSTSVTSVMSHIIGKYDLSFAPGWYASVEKATGIAHVDNDPAPLYGQ